MGHRRGCYGYHPSNISCEKAHQAAAERARRDLWICRWSRSGVHKFVVGSNQCVNSACECTYTELQESRHW